MNIIDPHLHLFNLSLGQYDWLFNPEVSFTWDKALIQKNFTEAALQLEAPLQISSFVHIEAGFDNAEPWREIAWLEQHCQLPFRSIAFIDISQAPEKFAQQLTKLQQHASLVGIRHILDEKAEQILSQKNSQTNLALLAEQQLLVEIQMPITDSIAVQLLADIAEKLSKLTLIINHAGWPEPATDEQLDKWQAGLKQLSKIKQCAIKCSGWEMMIDQKSSAVKDEKFDGFIKQVVKTCLDNFGEHRVMLASNFPLCLGRQSYNDLWRQYMKLPVTAKQLDNLCFNNAKHWYQIST